MLTSFSLGTSRTREVSVRATFLLPIHSHHFINSSYLINIILISFIHHFTIVGNVTEINLEIEISVAEKFREDCSFPGKVEVAQLNN